MKKTSKISVLFVCMGNICRSPTAQGAFEKVVRDAGLDAHFEIDSAGTHAYHVGEPPDRRATTVAANRDIDLAMQKARRVVAKDFARFTYVLAMDLSNLDDLLEICPPPHREKVRLFLEFSGSGSQQEVPDPYYGGAQGFERVLDMVEEGAKGLLGKIR